MKRSFTTILILFTLLAITAGSALADGSVTGMSVSRSGGLTFTFSVTGYLSASQLKGGYVQVQGGDSFALHCAQTDEFTVVCHAPAKINSGVTVGFGGSTFWVEDEDMPEPNKDKYCYNIYDYPTEDQLDAGIWDFVTQGNVCQKEPAQNYDFLEYDSPYWGTEWYYFSEQGVENEPWGAGDPDNWSNPGSGYYYWEMLLPN